MSPLRGSQDGTTVGSIRSPLGRVIHVGGARANIDLPSSMTARSFTANNQLALTGYNYDAVGRMISDGVSTCAWDARDQLVQIIGPVSAQFGYDALGRRSQKSINGEAKRYLYDGPNVIQEFADGATPSINAAYMTGLGLDETFGETTGAMKSDYLTDRLGSSVAVLDATGNTASDVSYQPYGTATSAGAPNGRAKQFAGRENDETGLIYLRARYYDPRTGAFLSEDPLGLGGGLANLYSYVGGDPVNGSDPTGLYRCVYLIRSGVLYCSPTDPAHPSFGPHSYVSGNNLSPACRDCQNNPNRVTVSDHGPIPPGVYRIGRSFRRPGATHSRRRLTPDPGRRFAFQMHWCGDPNTCSNGCIGGGSFDELDRLLSLEEGDNFITVFEDSPP